MKRILLISSLVAIILISGSLLAIHIWIGHSVTDNIKIAQEQYQGNAEDALIAFLLDEQKPLKDRTHQAIWTLGQIRSEKALPILREFYTNDPKGETCYGKHDSVLCQYEIYKALVAIEKNWWLSYSRLAKAE